MNTSNRPASNRAASNRTATVAAAVLIGLGILFLAMNLLDISFGKIWPIIFVIIGLGFYAPILIVPQARPALAALFIPGTVMLGLGAIFFYNIIFDDWGAWAYVWALIPASVGIGLILAARIGSWGGQVQTVGLWMVLISGAVFSLMAMFLGSRNFGAIGPIVLILVGAWLLFRAMPRSNPV
jgi:hypothetical protein